MCVTRKISVHHDLLAHNDYRNPQGSINGQFEVVNNVIFDYRTKAISSSDVVGCNMGQRSPVAWNAIGNYIKRGPSSVSTSADIVLHPETGTPPRCLYSNPGWKLYLQGNIGPHRQNNTEPQDDSVDAADRSYVVDAPAFHAPPVPVKVTGAYQAYRQVLRRAGATLPSRDAVDRRIVGDVKTGTGHLIDTPSDVGGWPRLAAGTPPKDADHDGIPNRWERSHGLNPHKARDGRMVARNGYTNLENYLNELAGDCDPCA
jgi:hypothetical protein